MGTSLFDPAQLGPTDIAKLLDTLRSQGGPNALGMAHMLPAMRSVASAPTAHMLPPMVSSAPAPGSAQMLPPMHSGGAASVQSQTPSAISALLQTLIGGPSLTPSAGPPPNAMGGPGPSVAQLPGAPSPMQPGMQPAMQAGTPSPAPPLSAPQSAEQPHMLHRIAGLLSDLGSGIKNFGAQPDAKGYEGLLSSDEIQAAKPGFMARLSSMTPGAPTPSEQYHANLDNIVKMRQIAAGVAETARQRSAIREMADRFPQPQPTGDPVKDRENMQQYLLNNYGFAMSHGLSDIGKEYGSSLRGIMAVPKPDASKVLGPGSALVGPHGEILAKTDPMDKAADYTQYVDPSGSVHVLKKDQNPPAGWKTVPMATTEIHVDAQAGQYDTKRADQLTKSYESNIKPLRERAAVIDQALKTIDDAAHNPNPGVRRALYSSAIANFIQAADQKAQIRYQLLNYYKNNVDPSIGGKWEVLKARLLNGSLPQYSMEGMLTHLGNLRGLLQSEIETQRAGLVKRHPELQLDDVLPKTSEYFPETGGMAPSGPASPANASALFSKYGLKPKAP